MKVRALDASGDWTFGQGRNNYLNGNAAVVQDINTRLNSLLGDCFFDLGAGIDWLNLLGQTNQLALNLAISAMILNTNNVTGLLQLATNLSRTTRAFSVAYRVQTIYSTASSSLQYDSSQR